MTIIAGFNDGGTVALAADTMARSGELSVFSITKIINGKDFAIGSSGGVYLHQVLERKLKGFEFKSKDDIFVISEMVREISIEAVKANGESTTIDCLVASRFGLATVYHDGCYMWRPMDAIGSGCEIALGAMEGICGHCDCAKEIVKMAATIAVNSIITCGGPVQSVAFDLEK